MLVIAFLRHIHFCSYYRVGLGVVQIRYFKTSYSATQRTFQVRTAATPTKPKTYIEHMYQTQTLF